VRAQGLKRGLALRQHLLPLVCAGRLFGFSVIQAQVDDVWRDAEFAHNRRASAPKVMLRPMSTGKVEIRTILAASNGLARLAI
jgi:hypothetical protein